MTFDTGAILSWWINGENCTRGQDSNSYGFTGQVEGNCFSPQICFKKACKCVFWILIASESSTYITDWCHEFLVFPWFYY